MAAQLESNGGPARARRAHCDHFVPPETARGCPNVVFPRGPGGADTVRSANRESSCARTRCPRSAESGATLLQGQVSTRAAELSLVDAVSECYADPLGFVMCFPWSLSRCASMMTVNTYTSPLS